MKKYTRLIGLICVVLVVKEKGVGRGRGLFILSLILNSCQIALGKEHTQKNNET